MRLPSLGKQAVLSTFISTVAQNTSSPLVNFQVSQPLTLSKSAHKCEVLLISRVFANSYYDPEIVQYTPPTDCGPIGTWAGISLNWTATSQGRQYDRLAGVTLSNVEIWRTSTSEPTQDGIIWTALKDVSKYLSLFAKPGTLIVDLNNIVDPASGLTGEYSVRLTATFYQSGAREGQASGPDLIVPLSTLQDEQSNVFTVPPSGNTTLMLPRNTISAFVEIQASGNYQDEFWYFNLPDEYLPYIPPDTTYGKSPFREVRILVDGYVAGIIFPYPVLFTGAFIPSVWRPIVAYGAYDTPTYNIDLTPFVPLLADGSQHVISLDVVSDESDGSINPNWYLSGNIQIVLDPSGEPTKGNITRYEVPARATVHHAGAPVDKGSYKFSISASHSLIIEADVVSGSGHQTHIVWKQDLQFNNRQWYLNNASSMLLDQTTSGSSNSVHNSVSVLRDNVDFPLSIDFNLVKDHTGSGYSTVFDHQYNRVYLPSPWERLTCINSAQQANGTYITNPNTGYSQTANGTNASSFSYLDDQLNSYARMVETTNNVITKDKEEGSLTWDFWPLANEAQVHDFSVMLSSFGPDAARIPGH